MKKAKRETRGHVIRLLPVTMTMLSLLLVIKANELYFDSRKLRELYAVRDAAAEEKKAEEKKSEEKKPEEKKEEAKPAEAAAKDEKKAADAPADNKKEGEAKPEAKEEKKEGGHGEGEKKEKPPEEPKTYGTGKTTIKDIEAQKERSVQGGYSKTELDLLQSLSKRREELDNRERELDLKANVLDATEKRISDRMVEMKTLEADLQKVLAQYNQKQDEHLKSLVRIYENMKPDEAAAIFNEMDMPILLDVVGRMSERKVAPVLANMNPKKARDVTQELAEKRKKAAAAAGQAPAGAANAAGQPTK